MVGFLGSIPISLVLFCWATPSRSEWTTAPGSMVSGNGWNSGAQPTHMPMPLGQPDCGYSHVDSLINPWDTSSAFPIQQSWTGSVGNDYSARVRNKHGLEEAEVTYEDVDERKPKEEVTNSQQSTRSRKKRSWRLGAILKASSLFKFLLVVLAGGLIWQLFDYFAWIMKIVVFYMGVKAVYQLLFNTSSKTAKVEAAGSGKRGGK